MKRIGFLSFGHWTPAPHSEVRSASDALLHRANRAGLLAMRREPKSQSGAQLVRDLASASRPLKLS
jgi:hypothetical protein